MNIIDNLISNKKTHIFMGIIAINLFIVVLINNFYPNNLEFNNYSMILTHIIALYGFIYIGKYILIENENSFKLSLLDSRIFFLFALLLLFYTPFYIILEKQNIAENLSIYVYYFLVIGVIYEIILLKFESKINSFKNTIYQNNIVKQKQLERIEKLALKRKQKKKFNPGIVN